MLLPAAALISAPRFGFTGSWIVPVGLMSLALGALTAWRLPPLLRRLDVLPGDSILSWLMLLIVLSFALKYGGRLYPESMPGDIQLHVNRYGGALGGQIYLAAQHRGLPFPFPPGLYVLLAPLTLLGIDIRDLFQLTAGLFEAAGVLLVYLLVVRTGRTAAHGLAAAAIYALTAVGFMTTWFSFQTQTAAQLFQVALMYVLAARWPHYGDRWTWGLLVMLMVQVFLGHIGQFLNSVLLGMLVIPAMWLRARTAEERAGVGWLLAAGIAACAFVGLFYYSAFLQLILEQVAGVASGGLNEVTGKQPIPPMRTLEVLWDGGLITHYGLFPVLLAVPGAALIAARRARSPMLPALLLGTFAVTVSQAVLPLVTLSSISTRYLSYAAWAVAVAGGLGWLHLRRRGTAARAAALAMALYVAWITAIVFVDAMFLRRPPIEPF